MPATAGRVRMPANNRVHSSAALQTHGIWQSAIGYDPYAPDQKQPPPAAASTDRDAQASLSAASADQQNTYDSFQGLLALARLTGSNADEARGACRKCGRVGHLPFQCRNFLKDETAIIASAAAGLNGPNHFDGGKDRTHDKGSRKGHSASDSSTDEDDFSDSDDSGLSDSSEDPEMERAIAAKFGKDVLKSLCKRSKSNHSKASHKRSHSKRSKSKQEDESDEKSRRKVKHSSRSKRSRSNASGSESDDSSDEERRKKRRRHSHKHGSSRSKHHSKHSVNSSERKRSKLLKKSKSSRKHRRESSSD